MKELKALEILKTLQSSHNIDVFYNRSIEESLQLINEAITELEELQAKIEELEMIIKGKDAIMEAMAEPKTCDGCEFSGYSMISACGTCSCDYTCIRIKIYQAKSYPDMYKPKAIK